MGSMIEIVEVGPRDGIQNESKILDIRQKLALINRLVASGIRRIEVGSFVNPLRVPQMAGTSELVPLLSPRDDIVYIGLALNERGCTDAIEAGVGEVGAVCVASDSFAMRNQGQTSLESAKISSAIVSQAKSAGLTGQVTIGAAFGCPFEGEVDEDHVVALAELLAQGDPREIALADTIGVAVPARVERLVSKVVGAIAPIPVRVHFHDTRNTAVANALAAYGAGVRIFDSSLGGLGGCPFAPSATGNVATEDLVYVFERSGISTGLDLQELIAANHWFGEVMGRQLPGMVSRAGSFPSARKEKL